MILTIIAGDNPQSLHKVNGYTSFVQGRLYRNDETRQHHTEDPRSMEAQYDSRCSTLNPH